MKYWIIVTTTSNVAYCDDYEMNRVVTSFDDEKDAQEFISAYEQDEDRDKYEGVSRMDYISTDKEGGNLYYIAEYDLNGDLDDEYISEKEIPDGFIDIDQLGCDIENPLHHMNPIIDNATLYHHGNEKVASTQRLYHREKLYEELLPMKYGMVLLVDSEKSTHYELHDRFIKSIDTDDWDDAFYSDPRFIKMVSKMDYYDRGNSNVELKEIPYFMDSRWLTSDEDDHTYANFDYGYALSLELDGLDPNASDKEIADIYRTIKSKFNRLKSKQLSAVSSSCKVMEFDGWIGDLLNT